MSRPCKYSSDKKRYEISNKYQNDYGKKPWYCESCHIEIQYNHKTKHLKTKKHLKNPCTQIEIMSQIEQYYKPWKCESCNISMKKDTKTKHLHSKKHLKNEYIPWHCDICNINIHYGSKVNHLQTEKHRRKECPTCPNSESESE